MPKNAKYKSVVIQNQAIHVMATMAQEAIINECQKSDMGMYSIKCDETGDANNTENMSLVLRYVKNGVAIERLLSIYMVEMKAVDAIEA